MNEADAARPAARERILSAAAALFYRYGYHAVGIDTVIAEAGVAKMTLYSHFASKDELIAAYLDRADAEFWEWFSKVETSATDARGKIIAVFEALQALAGSPTCLGCTFQAAAAEFPDPGHPGHQRAIQHKRAVKDRLRALAEEAGLREPGALAEQLLLLMDGAFAAARMFGPGNASREVAGAARVLIEAHSPRV